MSGILSRNNDPKQFAKMGRNLFNRGLYEDAAMSFERANKPQEATRAKV